MSKIRTLVFTTLALSTGLAVVSCGDNGGSTPVVTKEFSFSTKFESGRSDTIYMGQDERVIITERNPEAITIDPEIGEITYSAYITPTDSEFVSVSPKTGTTGTKFTITPLKETSGTATVKVKFTELNSLETSTRIFKIKSEVDNQNKAVDYSADETKRQQVLGQLEEYAMENMLSGITLFQEGGYMRLGGRLTPGSNNYIPGYGLGILTEGSLSGPQGTSYPTYLHSAQSSDPLNINAWDAAGSQVSDLNSYISTAYWGTRRMEDDTNNYEWYPVLAADKVGDAVNDRPIPLRYNSVEEEYEEIPSTEYTSTDTFKRWRVYVKTGTTEQTNGVVYKLSSHADADLYAAFNNTPIKLEDYEFTYKLLLAQESKLLRGTEAANDMSYGIKGANDFWRRTKGITSGSKCDEIWNAMKASDDLGIAVGTNSYGDYIDIELLNKVNPFYAMYYLSSNLYTPIPKAYMQALDVTTRTPDDPNGNYISGVKNYGKTSGRGLLSNAISSGPFYLEDWINNQAIVFTRNDDWFECTDEWYTKQGKTRYRYLIPGLMIRKIDTSSNADAIWNEFTNSNIDYCTLPKSQVEKGKLQTDIEVVGDSTFKLNVNSCNQDRWNAIFGDNGYVEDKYRSHDNAYAVKPWMSNLNFLKGLYWSIDRASFAKARGVKPSINYFADAYLSNAEEKTPYNTTTEHKNAVANWHDIDAKGNDNYGYSLNKATSFFRLAVQELVQSKQLSLGLSPSQPTIIKIDIWWMYQTDIRDYGDEICNYFMAAFNSDDVCGGLVKLVLNDDSTPDKQAQHAVTNWQEVYDEHLMNGKFDLGFGAISGNTLNPLNFMEVLKSDNSSGFTLNWGNDTSVVDTRTPIIYDGKAWSYDALWTAADHGAIVQQGKNVKPVQYGYMTAKEGDSDDLFKDGGTLEMPFAFTPVTGVTLAVQSVNIIAGATGKMSPKTPFTISGNKIIQELTPEECAEWNLYIFNNDEDLKRKYDALPGSATEAEKSEIHDKFRRSNYGSYWTVEVTYIMRIGDSGDFSETIYEIAKNEQEDQKTRLVRFAKPMF